MRNNKRRNAVGRMLVILLCFLWGGVVSANAAKKAWAKLADGALTFYYTEKGDLADMEYELKDELQDEDWQDWYQKGKANEITKVVFDASFADARPADCTRWFYECGNLETIEGISNLNTSAAKSMKSMFEGCEKLTALDVSGFATGNVTDMSRMFRYCRKLETIEGITNLTTSKVMTMYAMFEGCESLTAIDVSGFDAGKVTTMMDMFSCCSSLETIDGLGKLNTSEVDDMSGMFEGCESLTTLDVSGFVTGMVTDMMGMFSDCTSLETIVGLGKLNTSAVEDMSCMFNGCESLQSLDVSGVVTGNVTDMMGMFGGCESLQSLDVSGFDTGKVTNMSEMFCDCSEMETIVGLRNLNTSAVENMSSMFRGCNVIASLDVSNFDTGNVTSMREMFCYCLGLETIEGLGKLNTSAVTDMVEMFSQCRGLETIEGLKNLDTSEVTDMTSMFSGCASLSSLDLSGWETGKVETMNSMFDCCTNLKTIEGIGNLNTSSVKDMYAMFRCCSSLTSLDLSGWETGKVENMSVVFLDCTNLKMIEGIGNLNTSAVTDMTSMFLGCKSLTSLDLSKYNTGKVKKMSCLFDECESLKFLNLSGFDTRNVTEMRYMFSHCTNLESIFASDKFIIATDSTDYFMSGSHATFYTLPDGYETLKSNLATVDGSIKVKPYVPVNAKAEYGTLCVPMGSTLAEGSYTGFDKLYEVTAADLEKGLISLTPATSLEPGVPYVYHNSLSEETADPQLSFITFDADLDASTSVTVPANEGSLLKGTFEDMTALGGSYILQTDGQFHPVASGNATLAVGAYRAYLDLSSLEGGSALSAQAFRMSFGGGTTGIGTVQGRTDIQPGVFFDLMGRKVTAPRKGEIYITDGRKVVY